MKLCHLYSIHEGYQKILKINLAPNVKAETPQPRFGCNVRQGLNGIADKLSWGDLRVYCFNLT
jgi:hypothetical protein